MSGFGTGAYGLSSYGLGDDGIDEGGFAGQADLLVQSRAGVPGSPVIISGVGTPIVDKSRDDNFTSNFIDLSKWTSILTGAGDVQSGDGLEIRLIRTNTSASYSLISQQSYVSADVSLRYEILSSLNIPALTDHLVFVALQYFTSSNTYFTIGRRASAGQYSQQLYVTYVVNGVEVGRAAIQDSSKSGVFRIIKHDGVLMAMHNSTIMYRENVGFQGSGFIKAFSDLNGQRTSARVRYVSYQSRTGVMFGPSPMLVSNIQLGDKIDGIVPISTATGFVDVIAFNHFGAVGIRANGFKYPLVSGVKLSQQEGLHGTVQTDPQLRD